MLDADPGNERDEDTTNKSDMGLDDAHSSGNEDGDDTMGNDNNSSEEEPEELKELLASTAGTMPTWLAASIRYLYHDNDLWVDTLRSFIKLEEVLKFPLSQGVRVFLVVHALNLTCSVQVLYRLSSVSRPAALTQFINNHRKKEPTIDDADEFGTEVYLWWISLQPSSRLLDRDDSPSDGRSLACLASEVPNDETWDALRKGSNNGMFGMMCCLHW